MGWMDIAFGDSSCYILSSITSAGCAHVFHFLSSEGSWRGDGDESGMDVQLPTKMSHSSFHPHSDTGSRPLQRYLAPLLYSAASNCTGWVGMYRTASWVPILPHLTQDCRRRWMDGRAGVQGVLSYLTWFVDGRPREHTVTHVIIDTKNLVHEEAHEPARRKQLAARETAPE